MFCFFRCARDLEILKWLAFWTCSTDGFLIVSQGGPIYYVARVEVRLAEEKKKAKRAVGSDIVATSIGDEIDAPFALLPFSNDDGGGEP